MNTGSWGTPYTLAFVAIRFKPELCPGTTNPAVVRESAAFMGEKGARLRLDLDGDGDFDGEFNIGSLELVYPEGKFVTRRGNNIEVDELPEQILPITPAKVLRKINRKAGDPANFKLGDSATTHSTGDADSILINVSLLMADYTTMIPAGGDQVILAAEAFSRTRMGRWFNTTVAMQNMVRPGT
jgi:hypothetical protein